MSPLRFTGFPTIIAIYMRVNATSRTVNGGIATAGVTGMIAVADIMGEVSTAAGTVVEDNDGRAGQILRWA